LAVAANGVADSEKALATGWGVSRARITNAASKLETRLSPLTSCDTSELCATAGAAIVARLPGNPIGWLFIAVGLGFLLGGLADEWVTYAFITEPGALIGVDVFVWLSSWVSMAAALIPLIFILFPDGHPPSRRWRPVVVLLAVGIGVGALTSMLSPGAPEFGGVPIEKTWALPFLNGLPGFVFAIGSAIAIVVGGLAAVVALILRWQRAEGDERQQIRWVATAAAFAGAAGLILVVTTIATNGSDNAVGNVAFLVLIAGGAVAFAFGGRPAGTLDTSFSPFLPFGAAGILVAMGYTFIALEGFEVIRRALAAQ